jgi:hypothetical protein
MLNPGDTSVSIEAGTAQEWFQVLVVLGPYACGSAVLGAFIGVICRRRPRLQIPLSIGMSVTLYALLEWRFGHDEWSWRYPISSAAYQVGPVALVFILPAMLAAIFIGRLASDTKPKGSD